MDAVLPGWQRCDPAEWIVSVNPAQAGSCGQPWLLRIPTEGSRPLWSLLAPCNGMKRPKQNARASLGSGPPLTQEAPHAPRPNPGKNKGRAAPAHSGVRWNKVVTQDQGGRFVSSKQVSKEGRKEGHMMLHKACQQALIMHLQAARQAARRAVRQPALLRLANSKVRLRRRLRHSKHDLLWLLDRTREPLR